MGTGRELSAFLGVFGTCLGLSGVSACLSSVCLSLALGVWEQAAICSQRELCPPVPRISHDPGTPSSCSGLTPRDTS